VGKTLHILNGDSLLGGIQTLKIDGTILVWREMLCAGPTCMEVGGAQFFEKRRKFLWDHYQISEQSYNEVFASKLQEIDSVKSFDSIHLWFEYDLFCHINLLGALAWISQHGFTGDVYHICSGRVKGAPRLLGLSELSPSQLKSHYKNKVLLTSRDMENAYEIWSMYCGEDHNALIPKITTPSSFTYLSNCLKSHIERFPNCNTGLNLLETHILNLIDKQVIKSEHHLCGYALDRQGYYGYGDTQLLKMISSLQPFFGERDGRLQLNETGINVLHQKINVVHIMENSVKFGGSKKYGWCYHSQQNKLIKRP
jgi:hypothetical protein